MDAKKFIKNRTLRPMATVVAHCPYHGPGHQVGPKVTYVEPVDASPYTLWPCPAPGCDYVRVSTGETIGVLKRELLAAGVVEVRLSARPDGELNWEYWKKFVNWLDIAP